MAFWGVHLEPGKSYTHRYDKNKGKLRISQATLGIGCSTDITGVQCCVGKNSPILLCAFFPTKTLSCSLDLMFEEEDDVVFSVRGPRSVYLSGFYIGNSRYEDVIENNKLEVGGNCGKRKKRKHDTVNHAAEEKNCVDADHASNKDHSEVKKKRDRSQAQESDKNAKGEDEEQKVSTIETADNKDAMREDEEEQKVSNVETEDNKAKVKVKALDVKTFSNGLVIEDLEYGEPDSKKAHPGCKVSVFYTGEINNGNVFDTNVGGAPYKFKLGVGDVMKGWDVGLNGMRIGDKRRLTIPPKLGYNAKGVLAGKVPYETVQVFEIEVVDVR